MNAMDMKINTLPALTWNWLHMNEATLRGIAADRSVPVETEVPEAVQQAESAVPLWADVISGAGRDMDSLVAESGVKTAVFTVGEGRKTGADDAVRLHFSFPDQEIEYDDDQNKIGSKKSGRTYDNPVGSVNSVALTLEKNSEMTVVMDYTSEKDARGLAAVQTKISAAEGSLLRLIQVQRLGSGYTFINDIGGRCAAGARIEVIHLILSGKNTYEGCRVDLPGEKSSFDAKTGYIVQGNDRLDMNYDSYHTGKKTRCEMYAAGVLRDNAFKLYRGTIDLQKGCAGAKGNEMEDVLLMDDGVVNQTIPLILCAEEDVEGNHGATIGRLDENLMFYMESRGMNREEIYEMMAKARIDAIIRQIPDRKTREKLLGDEG